MCYVLGMQCMEYWVNKFLIFTVQVSIIRHFYINQQAEWNFHYITFSFLLF